MLEVGKGVDDDTQLVAGAGMDVSEARWLDRLEIPTGPAAPEAAAAPLSRLMLRRARCSRPRWVLAVVPLGRLLSMTTIDPCISG